MKKIILLLFIIVSFNAFAQHPCTPPIVTIHGTSWKCKGVRDTLTVTGPNGTTYSWNNATYITGPIEADSTFYVIATNNGCSDTTYFTVVLRVAPAILITPPLIICGGGSALLKAVASGTGPFTYLWSPGGATTDTLTVSPTSPTTFIVTVSNGCKTTKATLVTPDNPSLSACCNTTIKLGHDTILSASGGGMQSYSWTPAGTCLTPSCDSVRVSPTVTTTYTVTGTDTLGCQVQRLLTVVVGPAAIPYISQSDFVNIYPNPSSTSFTVDLKTKATIKVCDVTGRLLYSKIENAGTITFGKELNPGMYFLFIDGKPGVKVVKM